MIILGVDFGNVRTGLAICDKGEMLASPIGVISEHDFDRCMEKVADASLIEAIIRKNTCQNRIEAGVFQKGQENERISEHGMDPVLNI